MGSRNDSARGLAFRSGNSPGGSFPRWWEGQAPVSDAALDAVVAALGGERAWIVGGALRDERLGCPVADVDVALPADGVRRAAKALSRAVRGPAFELSGEFGAWRVIGPDRAWQ